MRAAEMPPHRWERITPTERDAIRLGNLGWSVPRGASPWPETSWGWIILNNRFAHERALEERLTRTTPSGFRQREVIFMDARREFEAPQKEVRSVKKMLQSAFSSLKTFLSSLPLPHLRLRFTPGTDSPDLASLRR